MEVAQSLRIMRVYFRTPDELLCRSDEYPKLARQHPGLGVLRDPIADQRCLLALGLERVNRRRRAVEHRNRVAAILSVAIHVGYDRTEKAVRLSPNLEGRAVIDAQCTRTPPNIHAQG
jgi:hypothetical protein